MSVQVTEAEWKIMECLWDHAPQTMGEITATLEPTTGWTRQTVITLLKRMTEKGAVSMDDSGRAKKYVPLITREEASTVETHKFLDHVFKGNPCWLTIWWIPAIFLRMIFSKSWISCAERKSNPRRKKNIS